MQDARWISLKLDVDTIWRLNMACYEMGLTRSQLVRTLIRDFLRSHAAARIYEEVARGGGGGGCGSGAQSAVPGSSDR